MSIHSHFLAVDLGASSGRVMDCRWDGSRFDLAEIHRFANGGVRMGSALHWDALRLWSEIQQGLIKFRSGNAQTPQALGIDAWGVDFGLLDKQDRLLANPFHYRDARTQGIPEAIAGIMDGHALFRATGVQTMEINTAFQLASMALSFDPILELADTLLMIPDLFQFLLCGEKRAEYTEASTTELYDLGNRCWSAQVLSAFNLPVKLFPQIVTPATTLGMLQSAVQAECGFARGFPCVAVASHDTASAVAALPGLDEASVFLSSGTWSLLGVEAEQPNLSDEFFQGGFTNEGAAGGVLLLKNMTGLWLLQECVRAWEAAGHRYSWTELETAALAALPFRSFVDPSAACLQSPPNMLSAIQHYCQTSNQSIPDLPGEVARCVFQSLSFSYRAAIESLEHITGRSLTTIRMVGGGCLNRFFCQMIADACGRTVIAGPVEAAALGNSMAQAVATGHLGSFAQGREALRQSVEFQQYTPANTDTWAEGYEIYRRLVAHSRRH